MNNRILPAHIISMYLWKVAEEKSLMEKIPGTLSTGVLLTPIAQLNSEPEFANANKPYGIYGFSESSQQGMDQIIDGTFVIRINAPKLSDLGRITREFTSSFESTDIATEALNNFAKNDDALTGLFRFTRAKFLFSEIDEPADSEGGYMEATITIEYSYISFMDNYVPLSARGGLWS